MSINTECFRSLNTSKIHGWSSVAQKYVNTIVEKTITNGIPTGIVLNVNIPAGAESEIKGIKICRQTKGYWQEEFEKRTDPASKEYYWLTGRFINLEPDSDDTDEWALKNNYVSIDVFPYDILTKQKIYLLSIGL